LVWRGFREDNRWANVVYQKDEGFEWGQARQPQRQSSKGGCQHRSQQGGRLAIPKTNSDYAMVNERLVVVVRIWADKRW